MSHLNPNGKSKIPLGHGDASAFECFRTSADTEDGLIEAMGTLQALAESLPFLRRKLRRGPIPVRTV
jgi:hypothetical protein